MPPSTSRPTQIELIREATSGFDALMNNDLTLARQVLNAPGRDDSCFHIAGLGITAFLQAALGQEDTELNEALATLSKAETVASASSGVKRGRDEPATIFPPGTEYKIIIADSTVAQALCHVLTESYTEFLKAIYKLNRAYKGFTAAYKIVFPQGVKEDDSLHNIITALNASYSAKLSSPSSLSAPSTPPSSLFGSWGRKSSKPAASLKASSSTTALPNLTALKLQDEGLGSASMPNSLPGSGSSSVVNLKAEGETDGTTTPLALPEPLWAGDTLSTLVISGAAFGFGLFGLIFSLLPPKMRKLIAWFGFSNSNRAVALKLLTVAASTGDDVHGYFASLALVTYYCVILLMSGWQADEAYLIEQCQIVLGRVSAKFPNGTLWVLNRAKLRRMQHDTHGAIAIIEAALEKGSDFREADSLLVFEISWCYLSDSQWLKAANSFKRMRTLNNWSHSTYVGAAAGALLVIPAAERSEEINEDIKVMMTELPSLMGMKRLLGEPPSTEMFITRKIACYKAKQARWIASGRLTAKSNYWDVVRITLAQELGLFWNTNGHAPPEALHQQMAILNALTPPPRFGEGAPGTPSSPSQGSLNFKTTNAPVPNPADDLDCVDEIATRDLILGSLYVALGDYETARLFLQAVLDADTFITDERWIISFATWFLAVLECKLGTKEEKAPNADMKSIWRKRTKNAEKLIESMFSLPEYDLKSRLESRAQMLRDEIAAKKKKVGI